MFGASAPATGFGKAPAAFGTGSAPAAGGAFGAPATATAPAFGAPKPGGFNVTSTATNTTGAFGGGGGGFGVQPASAPAATGTGGFAGSQWGGGFQTPQQQQPAAAATSGFGFQAQQPQQQQQQPTAPAQPPTVTLQDFARQSALANYLVQLDQSYNALHPKCHFTTFVYNSCGPGQMMDAIQKERYTAFLNGGGCSDEAYVQALRKNPDPSRLYPSPLHFSQELLRRTEKQREATAVLQRKVEELLQDVDVVAAMDAANAQRQREVEREDGMLRHRWYALLRKMELLRRQGSSYGEESLLTTRVEQLQRQLKAPGSYGQLLGQLRPYLSEELSRVAMLSQQSASASAAGQQPASPAPAPGRGAAHSTGGALTGWKSASGRPLLRSEVDPYVLKDWLQFLKQTQEAIETLEALLTTDLKEMRAVRDRVEAVAQRR